MKDLHSFLFEHISQKLKDSLLKIINADDFNDEDAQYLLNVAAPFSKTETSINRFNTLKYYIASRFIGGKNQGELAYEAILNILQKTNSLNSFLENVIDKFDKNNTVFNKHRGIDLAESGLNNTANIYNFFKDLGLSDNAMKQLAKLKYSVGGVIQGEFEVLTSLLISDLNSRSQQVITRGKNKGNFKWNDAPEGYGDIKCQSANIEYKCPGARVKDQKIGPAKAIQQSFDKFLKDQNIKNEMLIVGNNKNSSNAKNTILSLLNDYGIDYKDICNALGNAFAEQLSAGNADEKTIAKFLINHQEDLVPEKNKFNDTVWSRLIGCIQLKYYQAMANWDYIMVFCGKDGNEASNKGNFITISKDMVQELEEIYKDERIHFTGYLNNSSGWDDAVHIFAK